MCTSARTVTQNSAMKGFDGTTQKDHQIWPALHTILHSMGTDAQSFRRIGLVKLNQMINLAETLGEIFAYLPLALQLIFARFKN